MLENPGDTELRMILEETSTIALVGASPKTHRPSHRVAKFLVESGYRVIPVNPGIAGGTLFGETVYASLSTIPSDITIDMVDIFRRSDAVGPVVEEAIATLWPLPKTVWMQIGVVNEEAAAKARAAGIAVVQNLCPVIEIIRLQNQTA